MKIVSRIRPWYNTVTLVVIERKIDEKSREKKIEKVFKKCPERLN